MRYSANHVSNLWWIGAMAAFAFLVASAFDVPNLPFGGYGVGNDGRIARVQPDSPAAVVGLAAGDRVLSVAGIDPADAAARARQPRPAIGETRTLEIQRGEEPPFSVAVTYVRTPKRFRIMLGIAYTIALTYLACGLWALRRVSNTSTRVFALLGLALAIALVPAPHADGYALRRALNTLPTLLFPLLPALFAHLCLLLPPTRKAGYKTWVMGLIYGPAATLSIITALGLWMAPSVQASLTTVSGISSLILFFLGLGSLVYGFVRHTATQRTTWGLRVLLAGVSAGLLPSVITAIVPTLPGANFSFLTMLLVPFAFAFATTRSGDAIPAPGDGYNAGHVTYLPD